MVSAKFVEFDELLSINIALTEPEHQLLFDGGLVLTLGAKKFKCHIEDIAKWMETFSTFMLVLMSFFSTLLEGPLPIPTADSPNSSSVC